LEMGMVGEVVGAVGFEIYESGAARGMPPVGPRGLAARKPSGIRRGEGCKAGRMSEWKSKTSMALGMAGIRAR
jgi:hypothetical protein